MVGLHSGRSRSAAPNSSAALCAPPITATRCGRSARTPAMRCVYCVLWMTRSAGRPSNTAGTWASRPAPITR